MGLKDFFTFKVLGNIPNCCLGEIYPFPTTKQEFVKNDILALYKKILVDCIERSEGISEDVYKSLWDNCLESEAGSGLISMLSGAMFLKSKLFLVYNKDVLRQATKEEETQIEVDYKKSGQSSKGVFISFTKYEITDMMNIYSSMEYCTLSSLYKSMNVARALQLKFLNLRQSVSAGDSQAIINQAQEIARALSNGEDIYMDSGDKIESNNPEIDSIKQSIEFINEKKSFYLNLPISYITGVQTSGIGSSGEADMRSVERGLKSFFNSVLKPAIEAIFKKNISFKSQDFRMIDSGLSALKTFELIGEGLITKEAKRILISKILDIEYNPKDFIEADKEVEENKKAMLESLKNPKPKEDEKEDENKDENK